MAAVVAGRSPAALLAGRAPTYVTLGDSIIANGYVDGSDYRKGSSDASFVEWGNFLSGARARCIGNFAVGGYTLEQIGATVDSAIALRPTVAFLNGGTNNPGVFATSRDLLREIFQRLTGAGIYVIFLSNPPRNSTSAAFQTYISDLNRWAHDWFWINGGGEFVDMFGALVVLGNNITQAWRTESTIDYIHPSNLGGYLGGKALAPVFPRLFPPNTAWLTTHKDDPFYGDSDNVTGNPLMTNNTSGGSAGTGITIVNSLPSGYSISRTNGSPTANVGIEDDPDGYGKRIYLECTFGAAGDKIIVQTSGQNFIGAGKLAAGDLYRFRHKIIVTSPINVRQISAYSTGTAGSTTGVLFSRSTNYAYPNETIDLTVQSPIFPATGATSLGMTFLELQSSGAGSCRATVGHVGVHKHVTP
jgi:lysophospholipase L1-like esterase